MLRLRPLLLLSFTLFAAPAFAATLNVGPGQPYSKIQDAINAAASGDTIMVYPGTYYENIDFKGKAITVRSTNSTVGPAGGDPNTVIDGGSKSGAPTVIFKSGEKSTSVLSGLTIRNGGNTAIPGMGGVGDGGVYVTNASPSILGNTITANYCHNIDIEFGAATIAYNEVSGVLQSSGTNYCTFGSGIHVQGGAPAGLKTSIIHNVIENNLTGSGINLWAAQNTLISNNIIRNNTSSDPGSAFISANSNATVLVQNLIYGNTSTCGGALGLSEGGNNPSSPTILVANNTIVDNITSAASSGSECTLIAQIYPGPYSYGSSGPGTVIVNNIISGSTSYPAVNCSWYSKPSESDQPTFQNNILYNAGGPFFGSFCVDVSNKYNNIAADPQFVSPTTGDYHLRSTSPAIDHGQNSILQIYLAMAGASLTIDFDSLARVQNVTGTPCAIVDIGAYEFPGLPDNCSATETLQSSLNPSTYNQSVTFTATVTDASNGPVAGNVTFTDGATTLQVVPVNSSGIATYTTSSLSVGSHPITAPFNSTISSDFVTASLTQQVNPYITTANLTSSLNPSLAGQSVSFTATVTSSNGTPTGSITFADGATTLQTVALTGAGVATFTTSALTVGTHPITATYVPTGSFAASSGNLSQVVNGLASTSVLTASPTTAVYNGAPITLTATISPATPPGSGTPTGSVTFVVDGVSGTPQTIASGTATLSLSGLPGGPHSFGCKYSGDTTYSSSTCNSAAATITPASTMLTLTSSMNPAPALTPVTFTAHLTINGQPAPAGNTVLVAVGTGLPVTLTTDASGNAATTVSNLLPGTYTASAAFAGNTNALASNSPSLTEVITTIPTATTLTASPNPAYQGQPVNITASIASSATTPPTGTVVFFDAGAQIGSSPVNASGVATFTTSSLALGSHPLTANYGPTFGSAFASSTSTTVTEVIAVSSFNLSLSANTITIPAGRPGSTILQLSSVGLFSGPLTLHFGALPQYATGSLSSSTATLTAGGTASAIFTIQTSMLAANTIPAHPGSRAVPITLCTLLLLLPLALRRRSYIPRLLALFVAAVLLQSLTGCTNIYEPVHFVPAGTYQVPITATDSNNNTQTQTLTVIITP